MIDESIIRFTDYTRVLGAKLALLDKIIADNAAVIKEYFAIKTRSTVGVIHLASFAGCIAVISAIRFVEFLIEKTIAGF